MLTATSHSAAQDTDTDVLEQGAMPAVEHVKLTEVTWEEMQKALLAGLSVELPSVEPEKLFVIKLNSETGDIDFVGAHGAQLDFAAIQQLGFLGGKGYPKFTNLAALARNFDDQGIMMPGSSIVLIKGGATLIDGTEVKPGGFGLSEKQTKEALGETASLADRKHAATTAIISLLCDPNLRKSYNENQYVLIRYDGFLVDVDAADDVYENSSSRFGNVNNNIGGAGVRSSRSDS